MKSTTPVHIDWVPVWVPVHVKKLRWGKCRVGVLVISINFYHRTGVQIYDRKDFGVILLLFY